MAYELIGAEQVVELVTAQKISLSNYPKGVRYLTADGRREKFDTDRWYFETPVDGQWVRVNDDFACDRITTADITRYVGTNVSNLGGVRVYMDTSVVSPDMDLSMVEENYRVGQSTLVLGIKTACAGNNSIVQGDRVHVDRSSSYIMLNGSNSVLKESSAVIGTLFDSAVTSAENSIIQLRNSRAKRIERSIALVDDRGAIDWAYSSIMSVGRAEVPNTQVSLLLGGSHLTIGNARSSLVAAYSLTAGWVSDSIILGGGRVQNVTSSVLVSRSTESVSYHTQIERNILNSSVFGYGFKSDELSNSVVHGEHVVNGGMSSAQRVFLGDRYSYANTRNVLSLGDMNSLRYPGVRHVSVIGDNNDVGWWSEYMNPSRPISDTTCVCNGSVYGTGNYVGYDLVNFSVSGSINYLPTRSRNVVVVGNELNQWYDNYNKQEFITTPLTTVTVDELVSLASKGSIGKYAVVSDGVVDHVTIGGTRVELSPSGLTAYIAITGVDKISFAYPRYVPSDCSNIMSIGNGNTIGYCSIDSIFFGDNIRMSNTYCQKSVIYDNTVMLTKSAYISNVWWIGNGARSRPSVLSKLDDTTDGWYQDAFVLASSNLDLSEFYGIFTDPKAYTWGFNDDTLSHARKPDTTMVYAGGIALGGNGKHGSGYSDYGLLKLGSSFRNSSYVQNWKETSSVFGKNGQPHYLCTGTTECAYGGMSLVIQDTQEWDGTYRVKPQKIDSRGLDMDDIAQKLGAYGGSGIISKFGISAYISSTTNTDLYNFVTETVKPADDQSGEGYTRVSYILTGIVHGGIYRISLPNNVGEYKYTPAGSTETTVKYVSEASILPNPTSDDVGKQFIVVLSVSEYGTGVHKWFNTVFYKGMNCSYDDSDFAIGVEPNNRLNYILPMASLSSTGHGFGGMRNIVIDNSKVNPSDHTESADSAASQLNYATLFTVVQMPRMQHGPKYDDSTLDYCYVTQPLGLIPGYTMN